MNSPLSDRLGRRFSRSWELAAGLLFGVLFSGLFYCGYFSDLENFLLDVRFRLRGETPASSRIVLISITDKCLQEIGPWPWPRARHAELLDILREAKASTVAFDLIFSEPSPQGPTDDRSFAEAMTRSRNVILPLTIAKRQKLDNDSMEMVSHISVNRAIPELASAAVAEGLIDMESQIMNADGVIRNLILHQSVEGQNYYLLGMVLASRLLHLDMSPEPDGVRVGSLFLPFYTRWVSRGNSGLQRSNLLNYMGPNSHFNDVSYQDVLGRRSLGIFASAAVIVGARASGISDDVKFSPFGPMAGMEIHANLLQNILQNRVLHRPSPFTAALVIWFLAILFSAWLWWRSGWLANLIALGILGLWLGTGVSLFQIDIILELAPVLVMLPMQWAMMRLTQQFYDLKQRNRELARKVRELSLVNEVSQAVNFMGDLHKTLDNILSRAVATLGAERGSILLLDDRYESLVEEAVLVGLEEQSEFNPDLKTRFKTGEGIAGEVFSQIRPRLIQDIRREPGFTTPSDTDRVALKSLICVPLQVREYAIGVMNIVNKTDGEFDQEDLQLALTMANQAAVVIEKARLFNLATIDGLTGLIVHRHFQAKLEEEFRRAKRYDKPLSLIMTDIDHFKKFNDTWGHQTGDLVLREVAKTVRAAVRDTDSPARYGGEEFIVILPETDLEGAILFAERLRQRVELSALQGPKGDLKVTISIGVSSIPINAAETTLDMIRLADEAMYEAKHSGRNRVNASTVMSTQGTLPPEAPPTEPSPTEPEKPL